MMKKMGKIRRRWRGDREGEEGGKNKRAIEIALASRLCDHSKLKI
jgi:hypothetical protein